MEYYWIKRNELLSHEQTWRNFKFILLSERRQSEKATYCAILVLKHFGKGKTIKAVKRSLVARVRKEGGRMKKKGG